MADYHDRWIDCTDGGVTIRGYYFPWGTKHLSYRAIKAARRVPVSPTTGSFRVWGSSNPRYWASLDPKRAGKRVAFTLVTGRRVKPFLTPDDPDGFAAALAAHGVAVESGGSGVPLL